MIKRIIGLPGEFVKIENGKVILDSKNERIILEEKYLPKGIKTSPDVSFELGESDYFVLGDNRDRSSDSRLWGVLKKEKITGKALFRLWPLNKIDLLR